MIRSPSPCGRASSSPASIRPGCRPGDGCLPPVESQTIAIRTATPADAPAIGRIHVESVRETYGGALSADLLGSVSATVRAATWHGALDAQPPISPYVAEQADGDLVGFAGGGPRRGGALPHDAEVYAIYLLDAA